MCSSQVVLSTEFLQQSVVVVQPSFYYLFSMKMAVYVGVAWFLIVFFLCFSNFRSFESEHSTYGIMWERYRPWICFIVKHLVAAWCWVLSVSTSGHLRTTWLDSVRQEIIVNDPCDHIFTPTMWHLFTNQWCQIFEGFFESKIITPRVRIEKKFLWNGKCLISLSLYHFVVSKFFKIYSAYFWGDQITIFLTFRHISWLDYLDRAHVR